jgi:predicted negative regulator of RcsB-dependent stress response
MWDAAIRDDLKIHELAVRKQGLKSFFAIATQSDAALAFCRAGRFAEGASHAQQAYDLSVQAFGPRAGLTGGVAHTLASCLVSQGKLDPAWRLLLDIDTKAVAQLAGDKDWFANVELLEADISYRRGDLSEARKHLEAATPVMSRPETEEYQKKALQTLAEALRPR